MEGEEIRFRYRLDGTWYGYFGCPDKAMVTCDGCKRLVKNGQRVYLNFDTGQRFCEDCKASALTNFVQG